MMWLFVVLWFISLGVIYWQWRDREKTEEVLIEACEENANLQIGIMELEETFEGVALDQHDEFERKLQELTIRNENQADVIKSQQVRIHELEYDKIEWEKDDRKYRALLVVQGHELSRRAGVIGNAISLLEAHEGVCFPDYAKMRSKLFSPSGELLPSGDV